MFTGLVEVTGKVARTEDGFIEIETDVSGLSVGDSIAINGVCLTVAALGRTSFSADVSEETLSRTNLADLQSGDVVNLESPLRAGDPLGGHIVQGHVDGTGVVEQVDELAGSVEVTFSAAPNLMKYMVVKGSVAVDGVSLTVTRLSDDRFAVALIPHTLQSTNLAHRSKGDRVNIEVDVLAKYVERLLASRRIEEEKQ